MEKAYEEKEYWGCNILEVIENLILDSKAGNFTCTNFNGVMLYSDTVSVNSAYEQITGVTYFEHLQKIKEEKAKQKKAEEEFEKSKPQIINEFYEKGRVILDEKYFKEWCSHVHEHVNGLYHGFDLTSCLAVIKCLNDRGDFNEAKGIMEKQGHSGGSWYFVREMVSNYCDKGKDFAKWLELQTRF